eukprot:CAMPEP_0175337992 /NCGR_PEP_ID=MMETSP0095-20121207/4611_1 /TAXON_ID=311494 /ORGANISM="Alexandrium monilatum, Strain CCMP3105" /LENGTH=452 /DNA_ID=CAMNT_0016635393 /DNA_START=38 /DNA_END=1396 /DNA_ORIENTATION=-
MRPAAVCGIAGGALVLGVQIGKLLQRRSKPGANGEVARELQLPDDSAISTQEAQLIDGKDIAAEVRAEVRAEAEELQKEYGLKPGLAVILVGERKDSQSYVRMKKKAAMEANLHSVDITLPDSVSQAELLAEVRRLNADPRVHAILVQLPLPSHIDEPLVLKEIKVEKDADGFAAMNIGNLCLRGGDPPLAIPCTPAGCVELLQRKGVDVKGKNVVVLGRSNIVGMPVAVLLQSMDATVTVCHSRTKDMEEHVRRADILIAAIGKPEFVRGAWLKSGCIVIDVGINAIDDSSKKLGHRLVGDVHFAEAKRVAAMITPVPGGVGPMTIAMLLKNTLNLARHSLGLPRLPLRKTSVAAARAATTALPSQQDYAVVVSGGAGGDIWSSAVKASALREQVQSAASCKSLPAVVLEAPGAKSVAPVVLVGINPDGSRSKVFASGASFEEAKESIGAS